MRWRVSDGHLLLRMRMRGLLTRSAASRAGAHHLRHPKCERALSRSAALCLTGVDSARCHLMRRRRWRLLLLLLLLSTLCGGMLMRVGCWLLWRQRRVRPCP